MRNPNKEIRTRIEEMIKNLEDIKFELHGHLNRLNFLEGGSVIEGGSAGIFEEALLDFHKLTSDDIDGLRADCTDQDFWYTDPNLRADIYFYSELLRAQEDSE